MILTIVFFFLFFLQRLYRLRIRKSSECAKLTGEEDFELKLMMEDLKRSIKKTENYQNEIERALVSFQSELSRYLKRECLVAAAITAAVAVTGAGAAYGKQC